MGRFLFDSAEPAHLRGCFQNTPVFNQHPEQSMNSTVKSYLYFLAFLAVTKMVVKPIATQMNLPFVKDIV